MIIGLGNQALETRMFRRFDSNSVTHEVGRSFIRSLTFLIIACIGLCSFSNPLLGEAQGQYRNAPQIYQQLPVTVSTTPAVAGFDKIELVIQFVLGACGLWLVGIGLGRSEGAEISIAHILLGAILLFDVYTFQNQLNWWMLSASSPYDPAIGLAIPGTLGALLLLIEVALPHANHRQTARIIIASIAVIVVITSISLTFMAWPHT
jgi:hypothetical protein